MASAVRTKDHGAIQRWAEGRGGIPTIVKGTGGLLRIDFVEGPQSGGRAASLEEVPWERWFEIFDESDLTFLCSPEEDSKFFKLVASDSGRRPAAPRGRERRAEAETPAAVLVIEEDGRWTVGLENDESSLESFDTRSEALRRARELAGGHEPTEILVETASGGEEHIEYGGGAPAHG